jgi:hypothetical protein
VLLVVGEKIGWRPNQPIHKLRTTGKESTW